MKIITGKTGTTHVASADDGARNAAVFGTGDYVINYGDDMLKATIVDANNITIGSGDIVIGGRHARIPYGEIENIAIDSGTIGYKRIDMIVAEYKNTAGIESCTIKVVKGAPDASAPEEPAVTTGNILHGDTTHQAKLYRVQIDGITLSSATAQFTSISPLAPRIVTPYTSNPAMDGAASPGASSSYARGDHVHPSDTSKVSAAAMNAAIGRSTAVTAADTNYASYMVRGQSLNASEVTPPQNGQIAWTYE